MWVLKELINCSAKQADTKYLVVSRVSGANIHKSTHMNGSLEA